MTASTVVQENKGIKKYEYSEEHSVIEGIIAGMSESINGRV